MICNFCAIYQLDIIEKIYILIVSRPAKPLPFEVSSNVAGILLFEAG